MDVKFEESLNRIYILKYIYIYLKILKILVQDIVALGNLSK